MNQEPDRGIPEPEEGFVPGPRPPKEVNLGMDYLQQVPIQAQPLPPNMNTQSYGRVKQMLEAKVKQQRKESGLPDMRVSAAENEYKDSWTDVLSRGINILKGK